MMGEDDPMKDKVSATGIITIQRKIRPCIHEIDGKSLKDFQEAVQINPAFQHSEVPQRVMPDSFGLGQPQRLCPAHSFVFHTL